MSSMDDVIRDRALRERREAIDERDRLRKAAQALVDSWSGGESVPVGEEYVSRAKVSQGAFDTLRTALAPTGETAVTAQSDLAALLDACQAVVEYDRAHPVSGGMRSRINALFKAWNFAIGVRAPVAPGPSNQRLIVALERAMYLLHYGGDLTDHTSVMPGDRIDTCTDGQCAEWHALIREYAARATGEAEVREATLDHWARKDSQP